MVRTEYRSPKQFLQPRCTIFSHFIFVALFSVALPRGPACSSLGGDIISWLSCLSSPPRRDNNMASVPRPVRNTRGGLKGAFSRGSPRGGGGPENSQHGRQVQASGMGAWGSGRLERNSPARQGNGSDAGGQQQQRSPSSAGGGNVRDGYRVACRDRWMNVTKTMMGERAEITTTSGCVYEGVFHVLTPGDDPTPGGKRGMYRVRFLLVIKRVWYFFAVCFFHLPPGKGGLENKVLSDS